MDHGFSTESVYYLGAATRLHDNTNYVNPFLLDAPGIDAGLPTSTGWNPSSGHHGHYSMTEPAYSIRGNATSTQGFPSGVNEIQQLPNHNRNYDHQPNYSPTTQGLSLADIRSRAIEQLFQFSQPNANLTTDQINGLALLTNFSPDVIKKCFQSENRHVRLNQTTLAVSFTSRLRMRSVLTYTRRPMSMAKEIRMTAILFTAESRNQRKGESSEASITHQRLRQSRSPFSIMLRLSPLWFGASAVGIWLLSNWANTDKNHGMKQDLTLVFLCVEQLSQTNIISDGMISRIVLKKAGYVILAVNGKQKMAESFAAFVAFSIQI
jgi:hypothetical protein